MKPCIKCGATDRFPSGDCRPCGRGRIERYRASHPGVGAKASAKYRSKNPEKTKEAITKWRNENPDKVKDYRAKYYTENSEKIKAKAAKYYTENPKKAKASQAKWRADNQDKLKSRSVKYYKENCEKVKAKNAKYHTENPERIKEINTKSKLKRRCLGFVPLNKSFEGAEGHHIGKDYVIFIPKELHWSVSHNFFKGTNMKEINALALDYLFTSATI